MRRNLTNLVHNERSAKNEIHPRIRLDADGNSLAERLLQDLNAPPEETQPEETLKVSELQDTQLRMEREYFPNMAERLFPLPTLDAMYSFSEFWDTLVKVKLSSNQISFSVPIQETYTQCEVLEICYGENEYGLQAGDNLYVGEVRYFDDDKYVISDTFFPLLDCYDYFIFSNVYIADGKTSNYENDLRNFPEEMARYAQMTGEKYMFTYLLGAIPVTDDMDGYFALLESYGFDLHEICRNEMVQVEDLKAYYEEVNRVYG